MEWDDFYLGLAKYVSKKSKDPGTKVGSVIVDRNKRVVSLGYNGPPKGVNEATNRDQKLLRTIHAEANALHFAGRDVTGCSIYVTHPPCANCAAHVIQRGIETVVFPTPSDDFLSRWGSSYSESLRMFGEAGVTVTVIEEVKE